jgi:hypothetical protein
MNAGEIIKQENSQGGSEKLLGTRLTQQQIKHFYEFYTFYVIVYILFLLPFIITRKVCLRNIPIIIVYD